MLPVMRQIAGGTYEFERAGQRTIEVGLDNTDLLHGISYHCKAHARRAVFS